MGTTTQENIAAAFQAGNGAEIQLSRTEIAAMHAGLTALGGVLSSRPIETGFAWTDKKTVPRPTRQSAWFLGGEDGGFVDDPERVAASDGNKAAGKRGLELLKTLDPDRIAELHLLKGLADTGIQLGALAVDIPPEIFKQGTTRYRIAHYTGAHGGGIGVHVDGNCITGLLTNGSGLTELRYDGSRHQTDHQAISVMPGSTLYRASAGFDRPYLPTFHFVDMPPDTSKTSFIAAYNLPEGSYSLYGHPFEHDIAAMKAGDNPNSGPLVPLWERAASAHRVSVADLSHGNF